MPPFTATRLAVCPACERPILPGTRVVYSRLYNAPVHAARCGPPEPVRPSLEPRDLHDVLAEVEQSGKCVVCELFR
jgi:hypothetical protein